MSTLVEVLQLPERDGLDVINVFWRDFAQGRCEVTILCWGTAWTAYFGGMGTATIKEFFANAPTSYLRSKLMHSPWLKESKRHENYLQRIILAIQDALKAGDA